MHQSHRKGLITMIVSCYDVYQVVFQIGKSISILYRLNIALEQASHLFQLHKERTLRIKPTIALDMSKNGGQ